MNRQSGTVPFDLRAKREKLGANQTEFWTRVGVTQSAGSRYESGRPLPKPLAAMLVIAYGTTRQARSAVNKLRGSDRVIEFKRVEN